MNNEKDIINQLQNGHTKALSVLMSCYKDYVYSILISMLSREEADEACQDTFIKVYPKISLYNFESKFSTWLYTIAYRTGLDYLKKRKSHHSIDDVTVVAGEQSDNVLNSKETNQWIHKELSKLKVEDASLLKLYYLNEYSIEEVSKITGLSKANVKVKLYRIRHLLREKYAHLKLSDFIS